MNKNKVKYPELIIEYNYLEINYEDVSYSFFRNDKEIRMVIYLSSDENDKIWIEPFLFFNFQKVGEVIE